MRINGFTKSTALCGHYHQSSDHTETRIDGDTITTWSTGCLCNLHPKYMPLNKWNLGFALYNQVDKDFWHLQNKRIIQNQVV